jgi:uncharacterized protein YjiS (DUF1127 family)
LVTLKRSHYGQSQDRSKAAGRVTRAGLQFGIAAELAQAAASTWRLSSYFRSCREAFQEWRQREKLRADLCKLDDSLLPNIGMTRVEIDFIDERDIGSFLRSPPSQSDRSPGDVHPNLA